jgi:RNA polymerase sigma factor (sigma-70 family)
MPVPTRRLFVFHFCRLQRPGIQFSRTDFDRNLDRTLALFRTKQSDVTEDTYLDELYSLDWYIACACLGNDRVAWDSLFASRTGRADCLLVDALRSRAARLYPRNEEQQENAVSEFWGHLLVSEHGLPTLARYDGQRPLVPWLIRVFQNAHISKLRTTSARSLADDDIAQPLPEPTATEARWHDAFVSAGRQVVAGLGDAEILLLGLRFRYRLSQREIANVMHVHEGTISRQTDKLRDRCLDQIRERLLKQGWTGDDMDSILLKEMGAVLLDEPRLAADQLAQLLATRGRELPAVSHEGYEDS